MKYNALTLSESSKLHEIIARIGSISSPVLRLQAILQMSQIVDVLSLGDTSKEKLNSLCEENNRLQNELNHLKNNTSDIKGDSND